MSSSVAEGWTEAQIRLDESHPGMTRVKQSNLDCYCNRKKLLFETIIVEYSHIKCMHPLRWTLRTPIVGLRWACQAEYLKEQCMKYSCNERIRLNRPVKRDGSLLEGKLSEHVSSSRSYHVALDLPQGRISIYLCFSCLSKMSAIHWWVASPKATSIERLYVCAGMHNCTHIHWRTDQLCRGIAH